MKRASAAKISAAVPVPDVSLVLESLSDPYLILAPDFTIINASDAYLKATGLQRAHIIGRGLVEVFDQRTAPIELYPFLASLKRVLASRLSDAMQVQKSSMPSADGTGLEERYWRGLNTPVLPAQGDIACIIHRLEDVTELVTLRRQQGDTDQRQRAEKMETEMFMLARELGTTNQKLREENHETTRLLAAIIDSSADAILSTTLDGTITSWNGSAERLLGYSAAEAIGQPVALLYPPEVREQARQSLERVQRGERITNQESVRQHKDGHILHIATTVAPLQDELGRVVGSSLLLRDISARREAEKTREQLRQAQKMESLGQLTGGIAHDFNNLLAIILGNLDLMSERTGVDDPLYEFIRPGMEAAEHGAELTRQLLAFGRKQALQPKTISANDLLERFVPLVRRTLGERVEIILSKAPDVWNIHIDPSLLQNALLNLSVNARDAMPGGGKIVYETANAILDEDYASQNSDVVCGEYVMIAVSDTGMGMSAETMQKAFEPFFTTKPVGKGTGLGLSMVYGFVKQSMGHIKLYSEIGQGTSIKIYLPRAEGVAQEAGQHAHRSPASISQKSHTILVVEDNKDVLKLTSAMAEKLGYKVVQAETGDAALEILQARADIDLLLTDVMLPGETNGPALAKKAVQMYPGMKVLFNSGYAEHAIRQSGLLEKGVHLISKPFRKQQLADKLTELLHTDHS